MGEALSGMRLRDDNLIEPLPSAELQEKRQRFFEALYRAVDAGDEGAKFVAKRFPRDLTLRQKK